MDDSIAIRRVTSRILATLGLAVHEAEDGAAAVKAVACERYDLVFMDLDLPGLDGISAAREIRKNRPPSEPWIVAFTGKEDPGIRELCLRAGMNDFLRKPARLADFEGAIRRFEASVEARKHASQAARIPRAHRAPGPSGM